MAFILISKRELKSFRILYQIKNIVNFFKKNNNFGFFAMGTLFQPKQRILLAEIFYNFKLNINFISKLIAKFLFPVGKNLNMVSFLLKGSVFLIKTRENIFLDKNGLKSLFKHNIFYSRCLVWNNTVYPQKTVDTFLKTDAAQAMDIVTLYCSVRSQYKLSYIIK